METEDDCDGIASVATTSLFTPLTLSSIKRPIPEATIAAQMPFILLPPCSMSRVSPVAPGTRCPPQPTALNVSSLLTASERRRCTRAHGAAAATSLSRPVQLENAAPYPGGHYSYVDASEEDLGWRTNFSEAYLCGKQIGQVRATSTSSKPHIQSLKNCCTSRLQGSFGQVYLGVDLHTVRCRNGLLCTPLTWAAFWGTPLTTSCPLLTSAGQRGGREGHA